MFQVEVGLGGSIFTRSYDDFEMLACHGWFKHFWQLCDLFQVNYRVHEKFDIPLLREDDMTIMDSITDTGIYASMIGSSSTEYANLRRSTVVLETWFYVMVGLSTL